MQEKLKKEKYECAYMDNEGDLQESYRADYSSVELAFDLKNITLKMTSNQRDILKYLILGGQIVKSHLSYTLAVNM